MMMMKKVCNSAKMCVVMLLMMMMLLLGEASLSMTAVSCNAIELSPCLQAMTSNSPPSETCCNKLKEQKPCLCQYVKDPNLHKYINSPNAKKVGRTCGVPIPSC
ncbi:non-specific lipid-transfer protein 2-like [Telopea speciosissima]|uniref:non-specific lipid-transfer protein 2-like n=1 Tax=Telopea speciosissima TaxID=54955 RepID=UPI001CC56669|nr:non-specific lipid-transfer protein 2-like [Telopea speciosissima]